MRKRRRQIGIALFSISALSFVVARAVSPPPVFSDWWWSRDVGGVRMDVLGDISWICLLPMFLVGVIGSVFVVWPSRKPPKLAK